jgi:hypothetical protein
MKKLFTIALLLFAVSAQSATWTIWTMTVTNGTTTNDSYTIKGNTRQGATNRTSTTFLTNAAPTWATTNIFSQFGGWRVPGVLITNTGPTNIIFEGYDIVMTASNFAVLSSNGYSPATNLWTLMFPFTSYAVGLRGTNANQLVGLITNATEQWPTNATPLANYATRSNTWLVGPIITNGAANGFALTNFTGTGTNLLLSNSIAHSLKLTNASGTFTSSTAVEWALTNATLVNATGSIHKPVLYSGGSGQEVIVTNTSGNSPAIYLDQSYADAGAGIGVRFGGVLYWGLSFDTNEAAIYSASGNLITMSAGHVYIGDAAFPITAQGVLQPLAITNGIYRGTNDWNGDLSVTSHAYSSVVNRPGANTAIPIGTNMTVELSGATAFADIHSFENRRAGYEFTAIFSGQVTNVIVNQSGSEGTAALRITTGTGGNITQTNNPAWARFRKRSGDWLVLERSN